MRIYLVGFMGAGKSYLGRIWAAENALHFDDLDKIIEQAEGLTVAAIFEKKGESYFREKEKIVLEKTAAIQNVIIACGGGTPCFFDNMQWMLKNGTVVFLNETVEKILHNINTDNHTRPLLEGMNEEEKNKFIQKKITERLPIYTQSHITLSTKQLHEKAFKLIQYYIQSNLKNA